MSNVLLSYAARSTLLSLNSIQSDIDATQLRLATGKSVNSALDNPSAFFLSQSLSARASALDSLMTGLTNAQSTVSAANNGIAAIQSLLSAAQTVANEALASPASAVTITGINSTAFTTSTSIASPGGGSTHFKPGDTVTVSDGTTTATYVASASDTVQTFLDAINNTPGIEVTASLDANGQIELTGQANVSITIGGSLSGAGGGTLTSIIGLTAGTTNPATNSARQSYASQYDALLTQIDQAAEDAGFNGVDLLTGSSLSVTLDETGASGITVNGINATSAGLGVAASTNSFQSDADINTALTNVKNAIASLQTSSTNFSSTGTIMQARTGFNNAMITTLNEGADTLTATDTNADSAMLLALQTRQQIATTALSLTQGAQSDALRLFGM